MDNMYDIRIFSSTSFPADYLTRYIEKNFDKDLITVSPKLDIIIPDSDTLDMTFPETAGSSAVLFSSFEIYGEQFENAKEADATDKKWLEAEELFKTWCVNKGLAPTILRLPYLIGTGMTGEMRKRLNNIYRGVYRMIDGVNPQQSVMHALDLIPTVMQLAGKEGVYNVSDGVDPSVNEIAQALAKRINNKRVYTIKEKAARKAARFGDIFGIRSMDSKTLSTLSSVKTVSIEHLKGILPDWKVTDTIAYIRGHKYSADDM